jgi:hypothetical protein
MLKTKVEMVGAIGFEPSAFKQTEVLAGLGWQLKDRNGSQRNNYWTRIGHSLRATNSLEQYPAQNRRLNCCRTDDPPRQVPQNPQPRRNKTEHKGKK